MMFFIGPQEVEAIQYWMNLGYAAAEYDTSCGHQSDEQMHRHLCYIEFVEDLSMFNNLDSQRAFYVRVKPFLLHAFERGYRNYVANR